MKVFTTYILFFLLSISATFAQRYASTSSGTVKGVITDSATQKPLARATVVITDAVDMSTQQMLTRTDGSFFFEGLTRKYYIINVSYIEYNSKVQLVDINTQANLGTIRLSQTAKHLKEVVVVVRKKLTEYIGDKLIYNVAEDNSSRNASLYEVLQKIPTITRDEEDNIQVNGKTGYLVMVNGRKSSLFVRNPDDVYRNFPAENIKSIEVMNNPPSRYESEGFGGAINIVLNKQTINGYNAGIGANGGTPESYGTKGHINGKWGKFNVRLNSSLNFNQNPTNSSGYTRKNVFDQTNTIQNRTFTSENRNIFSSAEIGYELDSSTLISIEHDISSIKGSSSSNQQIDVFLQDETLQQSGYNYNRGRNQNIVSETSIDIQHSLKNKADRILTFSAKNSDNNSSNINKFISSPISNFITENTISTNTELFTEKTIQLDYAHAIQKHQIEIGAKIIDRKNGSNFLYQSIDNQDNVLTQSEEPSNMFNYEQKIYAAYSSLNLNWKRTFLRMGSRFERTFMNAEFISENTKANQDYFNAIPSITAGTPLKKGGNISASWSQRIERPGIFYLNPYVYLIDSKTIEFGNPNLKPALSNQYSIQYSYFHRSTSFFISAYQSFANNGIQRITTLKDSVTETTYDNIGSQKSSGMNFSLNSMAFKKLSFGINGSINYTKYAGFTGLASNSGFFYNYGANAALRLKHSLRINTSTGYYSGRVSVPGKTSGYLNSSLSINKDFGENKQFSVNLTCQNPWFGTRKTNGEIISPDFIIYRYNVNNVRRINLSLNYRFGQYNGRILRKRKGIQNDDLLGGDKSSD